MESHNSNGGSWGSGNKPANDTILDSYFSRYFGKCIYLY